LGNKKQNKMKKEKIVVREDISTEDKIKYALTPGASYEEGSIFVDKERGRFRGKVVQVVNNRKEVVQVPIDCFEEEDLLNTTPISPYKNLPHTKHH
jgi:hypothetical protein